MPYAPVNDISMYYEVHGDGEPLLLIAGQGSDHHTWDFARDDFIRGHRVILFDHRGAGLSDKPREPAYSTRGFAADVVALLDYLEIPRAHAYGISMGGRICQWLGIDYPDRIGALVLGCTTPGNAHGVPRPAEVDRQMANRPADPSEAIRFLVEQMVTPGFAETHPEYVTSVRRRIENPIPEYARKLHYQASEAHDTWDLLPSITAPVLVLHGDDDQVNPTANAPLLADRIRGAELHIVAGGRHGYFIEFREEASRVVLNFLRRHPIGNTASV